MDFDEGDLVRTSTTLGVHHGVVADVLVEGDRTVPDYVVRCPDLGLLLCANSEVTAAFPEPEQGDSGDAGNQDDADDASNSDGVPSV